VARLRLALVALALLAVASPARAQLRAFASADRVNRTLSGRVDDYTRSLFHDRRIDSAVLGQKRDLYVYVPPGYDPRKSYPILLYFHVSRVDEHELIGSGRLLDLDRMIVAGEFPPTVVVCPDATISGRNSLLSKNSFNLNGEGGRFEDHVMTEVLPFVTSRYSIRPEKQAHAILGVSGGGLGALSIAIRHRDYFGVVATLAAPANLLYSNVYNDSLADFDPATFRWRDHYDPREIVGRFYRGLYRVPAKQYVRPVFGRDPDLVIARITAINPATLISTTNLQPGELAIYMHYAGSDGYNFSAQDESFAWLAAQRGIAVDLASIPEANHDLAYFRKAHQPAFEWLARQLCGYGPAR